jgi:DNA-binding beta-propeller fold protein YncE
MNRRELLIAAAATPIGLGWPTGARASARGGTPLALVTADSESRILAVDLTDMRIVRSLAVPHEPHGIEAVDLLRAALVMSNESGTITVLDATVPRVRRVLDGFQAPRYAAGDPRGRYAYVSDEGAGQVIAIDVPAARVIGRVEVGKGARHISISPDGTRVITSLGSQAPRLALVDVTRPPRPRLVRTFAADDLAHDVGFTPDGEHVWISSGVDRRLAVHDARTLLRLRALPGDAPPQHVTFDDFLHRVYVTSGDSGTLRTYRMADAKLLRTSRVTTGSYNVCALSGRVVTPSLDDGRLTLLDDRGLRSAHVAPHAHDACIVVGP